MIDLIKYRKVMFRRFKEGLSRNVVILGVVSALTDISSEMLYPVIPIFLTTVLNAPMSIVGIIEGIAESTASILKIFGGYISDRFRKRKIFIVWGYSLSAISKPLMAFANTWIYLLFARFIDRVGKGIRTSPRDALIASSTDRKHWGKAFGFHRSMDTFGAALGPLITLLLLGYLGEEAHSYRKIFLIAFIPAIFGVAILIRYISETKQEIAKLKEEIRDEDLSFSYDFKFFLFVSTLFFIAKFSDAFFIMKAKNTLRATSEVIWVYFTYNIVYTLLSTPAGIIADKIGKVKTFTISFFVYSIVCYGFSLPSKPSHIWILFTIYGIYSALNEGIAKAIISELTEEKNRATAMGVYQGITGIALLFSSIIAGVLWDKISSKAPFYFSATLSLLAALLIIVYWRKKELKRA